MYCIRNEKKSVKRLINVALVLLCMLLTLPGCGDSSDGSSADDPNSGTTKAAFDEANVEVLLMDVFEGVKIPTTPPYDSKDNRAEDRVSATGSKTITGSCGGTADIDTTVGTSDISMDINYVNFCNTDPILKNDITYNGMIEMILKAGTGGGSAILEFSATYVDTEISYTGFSTTANGEMTFIMPSLSSSEATYNMSFMDNLTNKETRFDNFILTTNNFGKEISISGKYTHPDHGYVIITTPDVITTTSSGTTGRIHIEGSVGASGNIATADMTFNGTTATIEADFDGDGTIDFTKVINL